MKISRLFLFFILLFYSGISFAQPIQNTFEFELAQKKKVIVPFEFINNFILVPLFINDSDTLRFIVDTGVGTTLLSNLTFHDFITLNKTRKIKLAGLGQGEPIDAFFSSKNNLKIPGIVAKNQDIIVLTEDFLNLSASIGKEVHGLIGYDFFKSFIVEIDYIRKKMILSKPETFKTPKKHEKFKITLEDQKPFLMAQIQKNKNEFQPLKMLIDLGASFSFSIYSWEKDSIALPQKTVYSFLGKGLNGDIYGKIGRVGLIKINNFEFHKPIVSFPDQASVKRIIAQSDRNGSLGTDVIKRFSIVFDYQNQLVYLKPNSNYKKPFKFNMSGIEVGLPFMNLPIFVIEKIRPNSPGSKAGLKKDDQIIALNGINATKMSLNEIKAIFQSKAGRKIRIDYWRAGKRYSTKLVLEDII